MHLGNETQWAQIYQRSMQWYLVDQSVRKQVGNIHILFSSGLGEIRSVIGERSRFNVTVL